MTGPRRIVLSVLPVVVALAFIGCHAKTPVATAPPAAAPARSAPPAPPPPPPPRPAPPSAPQPAAAPRPLTEDEVFARKSLSQLNDERPLADTYFDLDQADIRDDARTLLQKDAAWMKRWPQVQVTIEGHCDARGTAEYNLALGSRRGDAVKSYLVGLGIGANRLTVVSKGKEQPVCADEAEPCWQQNRRGHFVITAK